MPPWYSQRYRKLQIQQVLHSAFNTFTATQIFWTLSRSWKMRIWKTFVLEIESPFSVEVVIWPHLWQLDRRISAHQDWCTGYVKTIYKKTQFDLKMWLRLLVINVFHTQQLIWKVCNTYSTASFPGGSKLLKTKTRGVFQ